MAADDLEAFIREITRRNEIVWNGVRAELEQGRLVLIGLQHEIADHRDETRARTQGLLRLLDRRSRGED